MDKGLLQAITPRAGANAVRFTLAVSILGLLVYGIALLATFVGRAHIVNHARGFIAMEIEERARSRPTSLSSGLFTFISIEREGPRDQIPAEPPNEQAPATDDETALEVATEESMASSLMNRFRTRAGSGSDPPASAEEDSTGEESRAGSLLNAARDRLSDAATDAPLEEDSPAANLLREGRSRADAISDVSQHAEILRQRQAQFAAELESHIDAHLDKIIQGMVANYRKETAGGEVQFIPELILLILENAPPEMPRTVVTGLVQRAAEENAEKLERWEAEVRGDYTELTDALISELRTFTTINMAVFLLMATLMMVGGKRAPLQVVPSILLLIACLTNLTIYIFFQDWSSAVLEGSYWGNWTAVCIIVFAAFNMDIYYLNGQVTLEIFTAIAEGLNVFLSLFST
ncbi:MAG: hypothetical protein JJU11_02180 [Candidatus Sumerlaeia bacterium]|nr:hypothetical protein [Candidatus Sumerlaeia bacterium]